MINAQGIISIVGKYSRMSMYTFVLKWQISHLSVHNKQHTDIKGTEDPGRVKAPPQMTNTAACILRHEIPRREIIWAPIQYDDDILPI